MCWSNENFTEFALISLTVQAKFLGIQSPPKDLTKYLDIGVAIHDGSSEIDTG